MIVFLTQSKYFDQLSHRKTKQKQNKKRFIGVTEKKKKKKTREILKHIWWEVVQ